jgi:hypothetical protein
MARHTQDGESKANTVSVLVRERDNGQTTWSEWVKAATKAAAMRKAWAIADDLDYSERSQWTKTTVADDFIVLERQDR